VLSNKIGSLHILKSNIVYDILRLEKRKVRQGAFKRHLFSKLNEDVKKEVILK